MSGKAASCDRVHDTCLFEEGWLHPQVFGDHVQAEEVSVDSCSRHRHPIKILVPLRGQPEETPALFLSLLDQITFDMTPKKKEHSDDVECWDWTALVIINIVIWNDCLEANAGVMTESTVPPRSLELWQKPSSRWSRIARSLSGPPWTDGSSTPRTSGRNHPDPGARRRRDWRWTEKVLDKKTGELDKRPYCRWCEKKMELGFPKDTSKYCRWLQNQLLNSAGGLQTGDQTIPTDSTRFTFRVCALTRRCLSCQIPSAVSTPTDPGGFHKRFTLCAPVSHPFFFFFFNIRL